MIPHLFDNKLPRRILPHAIILLLALACNASSSIQIATVDISQLQQSLKPKGKPMVVNHWATWCGPCLEEMPLLSKAVSEFSKEVDFVGVSWDLMIGSDEPEQVEKRVLRFSKQHALPFSSYLINIEPEKLGQALQLDALHIPQTYVFDRQGKKLAYFELLTEKSFEKLRTAIQQALQ